MKLKVLADEQTRSRPWYAEGLRFTCTQCGNCCTGGPGYVWISDVEVERLARHLGMTVQQVADRYCRNVGDRLSLREYRNSRGQYDCVFLREEPVPSGNGDQVVHAKRTCAIYPVRPLQCRTWPFWTENLRDRRTWDHSGQRCPGINSGDRLFSREQIEALRDAKDWPANPPTSGAPIGGENEGRG